jgi:hypothetical protein
VVVGLARRRARAFFAFMLVGALLLAACGGDDDDSASGATGTTQAGGDTSTTAGGSGGNGDCFTDPGTQTARVRFVNLYTNETYPKGDIDVYQGFNGTGPCGKKLATVAFGEATDYIDVTAADESGNWNTTAYVAGSTDDDHKIITQSETWKGGEQVTIVFAAQGDNPGSPASFGSDQAFFEKPTDDNSGIGTPFEAEDGKALIGIAATSVQYSVPDGAWVVGADGVDGCLKSQQDTEFSTTNVGGTQLVQYQVDPGSYDISLYDSETASTCSGTADIGPASVDAQEGSRTFVFAYGTGPDDLQLLVLPVEE